LGLKLRLRDARPARAMAAVEYAAERALAGIAAWARWTT
jgi:hypothetical protein